MEYLLDVKHKETRLYFGHYSSELRKLIIRIRVSKYKDKFLEHKDFFDDFVGKVKL
jgi:hypothetical protein